MGRNGKDKRGPEIDAATKELKSKFKKVGAIGYCYGGWAVLQLGTKGKGLADAISTAHASALTKEEIAGVGVPVQILCECAHDTEVKQRATRDWSMLTSLTYYSTGTRPQLHG